MDYYKILKVDKNAKEGDLKSAYSKFANEKKQADAKFKQISEAYQVLSDPRKRRLYDEFGAEGVKGQVPSSPKGDGPSTFTGYRNTGFVRSSHGSNDDVFEEFFWGGKGSASSSSAGGIFSLFQSEPQKDPPIQKTLLCSLEDLYLGITKKMKISRDIVDVNGKSLKVDEMLNIDIKRGWKKGTKITFPEKGNVKPNVVASDVVFIIDEKPHSAFNRDGNDLIITQNISALEAFTGYTVRLATLDGRNLSIPIHRVIHPNHEEVVPQEGMPIQNDPTARGNLRIRFNINFPTMLTSVQKAGIRRALGTV